MRFHSNFLVYDALSTENYNFVPYLTFIRPFYGDAGYTRIYRILASRVFTKFSNYENLRD